MSNFQTRNKFFYAPSSLFPNWPYKSRNAIGMRFDDFMAMKSLVFRFKINGRMYSIEREKAIKLGNVYKLTNGTLPNIIPLDEFTCEGV